MKTIDDIIKERNKMIEDACKTHGMVEAGSVKDLYSGNLDITNAYIWAIDSMREVTGLRPDGWVVTGDRSWYCHYGMPVYKKVSREPNEVQTQD